MRPDLVMEVRAWVQGAFQDVEIGLDLATGKILAVKKTLQGGDRVAYPGLLLIPSAVDLHVHLRDPGHPKKEDFRSGTAAAAMGGVGTVLDMPNTDPLVDRPGRLEEKLDRVKSKAIVDFGLWGTITDATPSALALASAADAVKLYLAPTTGIPDAMPDAALQFRLETARKADRLVALHAETAHEGPVTDLLAHHRARTPEGEVAAIRRAARLATAPGNVHVAHASTAASSQAANEAGFTAGVTPHHLLLSADEGNLGARGKVNPPLRSAKDRAALWDAFVQGAIQILETDHAPHTVEEKSFPFGEAPAGLPGLETAYPLLLREFAKRKIAPGPLIAAYSENPAQRLGLKKGRIEAGYDADFFLIDPRNRKTITADGLQSKAGWTPFEGWETYELVHHYLRGDHVVEDGQLQAHSGRGRRIRPTVTSLPVAVRSPPAATGSTRPRPNGHGTPSSTAP